MLSRVFFFIIPVLGLPTKTTEIFENDDVDDRGQSAFSNSLFFLEGPEGAKWELGFAYFWLGKWDFMHSNWDSSAKKQ